ncbi:hypothetical protein FRX31_019289, partial [Thalictrum thalictroides]
VDERLMNLLKRLHPEKHSKKLKYKAMFRLNWEVGCSKSKDMVHSKEFPDRV